MMRMIRLLHECKRRLSRFWYPMGKPLHFDEGNCGWISPRGDFYSTGQYGHSGAANTLHILGSIGLENDGWIHVPDQESAGSPQKWNGERVTSKQAIALRRIGIKAQEVSIQSPPAY